MGVQEDTTASGQKIGGGGIVDAVSYSHHSTDLHMGNGGDEGCNEVYGLVGYGSVGKGCLGLDAEKSFQRLWGVCGAIKGKAGEIRAMVEVRLAVLEEEVVAREKILNLAEQHLESYKDKTVFRGRHVRPEDQMELTARRYQASEAKKFLADMQQEYDQKFEEGFRAEAELQMGRGVIIAGVVGNKEKHLNGVYEPTGSAYNDKPLLRKHRRLNLTMTTCQKQVIDGDEEAWLRFSLDGRWMVSSTPNKDANDTIAWCASEEKGIHHPTEVKSWKIYYNHNKSAWEKHPPMTCLVADEQNVTNSRKKEEEDIITMVREDENTQNERIKNQVTSWYAQTVDKMKACQGTQISCLHEMRRRAAEGITLRSHLEAEAVKQNAAADVREPTELNPLNEWVEEYKRALLRDPAAAAAAAAEKRDQVNPSNEWVQE